MKEFVVRLQKDLKSLQDSLKIDSDQLMDRIKKFVNKKNLAAAAADVERLLELRIKKLEPTLNKVLGQIRRNAAKAGINVEDLEAKIRSNVFRAASTLKQAAASRGFTKATKKSTSKVRSVTKTSPKTLGKTPAKASSKSPSKGPSLKTIKAKPQSSGTAKRKAPARKN
ncbi:MAG: hypothetical protein NTV34_08050 [Proteobacteria bacterium]|nr:hypothetical protein [Pseudomonadota bacterium]